MNRHGGNVASHSYCKYYYDLQLPLCFILSVICVMVEVMYVHLFH
jgi:hypothetical protein